MILKSLIAAAALLYSTMITSAGTPLGDPGASPMSIRLVDGVITATGVIDEAAYEQLAAIGSAIDLRGKTFRIHSNGGQLQAAMQLGRYIRANEMDVEVVRRAKCASACAMIVLPAGVNRKIALSAEVSVHQPYIASLGGDKAKKTAIYSSLHMNTMLQDVGQMMQYLGEMNMSTELLAISFTRAPWRSMRVLSRDEMERIGLLK